jgi:beta-lactam-binding protein with PASTA domain
VTEFSDGMIVDGRYRIVRRIGSGGMADVYLAEDTHLGREVALKVLHRRFAQDAEFVERFRREAKAAAGLQHPHVVGVFDRGEHDGTYYIAMEHLSGRTLKTIVATEAPLDQLRVIDLSVQILQAAGFAHRHGVIHRDFKPHNVIVDAQDSAKVTDFGIARAGASEMTETGSIMGTAQYLSPEQAQGQPVTAASDVYSIGVMLYEMLTGRLPFDGDSAVSIALKHLSEPPPPMSREGLRIEPNLEAVVLGALAKDPAARWQSAEDLAAALEACRPYVQAMMEGAEPSQATAVFAAVPPPDEPPAEEHDGLSRWPKIALAVLTLALLAVLAWTFTRPEQIDLPKVVGMDLSDARVKLDRAGFENIEVQRERSLAPTDRVLGQDPDPGEQAARTDTITLAVSGGPGEVIVPSVRGLSRKRALEELRDSDLKVTVDLRPSDSLSSGLAIGSSPRAGTEVDRRSQVRLFVSSGPEQIEVPDLVGLSEGSATARLDDLGLTYNITSEESDEPEGEVIDQTPAAGTLVDGAETISLTIAEAAEQVTVPDVSDLPEREATRVLRGAGLSVSTRDRSVTDAALEGVVLEQRPAGGTEANEGSDVVIVVGRFEEPAPPDPSGDSP